VPHDRSATGQAIRRFTLGSGPLKRTSDRLEVLARVLLVSVLLSAVAIALAVATASYTQARSEADAQAAERRQVDAELVDDASVSQYDAEGVPDVWGATASWTGPNGVLHTAVIPVDVQAKAGSTHAIWIDRNGDRTTRPLSDADVSSRTAGVAFLTYLGISTAAIGAYLLFRIQLDSSRSRRWAAEWAVVEPTWTRTGP
jgi:hypothetical protein